MILVYFLFSYAFAEIQYSGDCNQFFHIRPKQYEISDSSFGYGALLKLKDDALKTSQRSVEHLNEIKIASYNVLQLHEHRGKWIQDSSTKSWVYKSVAEGKPEYQKIGVAKAIEDIKPDILVMQEVGNAQTLDNFQNQYLRDQYRSLLIDGNDGAGIDIGFLIRKDLPLEYELHSFKHVKDNYFNQEVKVFTRDLPMLVVRQKGEDKPLFILFGNHLKSKRGATFDEGATLRRQLQIDHFIKIKNQAKEYYGNDVPILLAGDFNNKLHDSEEFKVLFNSEKFQDVLSDNLPANKRATHSFFTDEGVEHNQIDGIIFDQSTSNTMTLESSGVYQYKGVLPNSAEQRDLNPSDHFPIYATFKLVQ